MLKKMLVALLLSLSCTLAFAQKPDLLEVIMIDGEIGRFTATALTDQIEKINDNPRVKAILLVVDTPGGGVSASAAIYEELSKLKVPVVGWCNNICASGGMYILMAPSVKYIGVRSQTIAGSIGVVSTMTRYNRLLDWAKIDTETFKSGSLKDSGNPTRDITESDRKYLHEIIDGMADRFYEIVKQSRKITDWNAVKSARIFIGPQVVKVGLADAVMSKDDALNKAKELSGSKTIFTREELKKMSKAADEGSGTTFRNDLGVDTIKSTIGDLPWVIETLKEIQKGESTRFEYRMPYTF